MLEAKWLRTCNPYAGWKLWRDWTPPKPVKVESSADVRKRQLSGKPAGYTWKLWSQHRRAKPTKRATPGPQHDGVPWFLDEAPECDAVIEARRATRASA
jgi:hypothetical protein